MVVLDIYIYQSCHFPCSLFCPICFSCSLRYGSLLTIDLALQFVQRRCALHTFTVSQFKQAHMYKSHALWWGGGGPHWTQIPEPHHPLLFSLMWLCCNKLHLLLHQVQKPLCLQHWTQALPHIKSLTPCFSSSPVGVKKCTLCQHLSSMCLHLISCLQPCGCVLTIVFHHGHPRVCCIVLFCAFSPSHMLSHISALQHFHTHYIYSLTQELT